MKLSDIKNEQAIEALADLIRPARELFSDERVRELIKIDKFEAVSHALKTHSRSVFEILAILDGVPVEQYECNIMTLPNKLLEIFSDQELMGFLYSQVPDSVTTFFGNATENTEGAEIINDSSVTIPEDTSENNEN